MCDACWVKIQKRNLRRLRSASIASASKTACEFFYNTKITLLARHWSAKENSLSYVTWCHEEIKTAFEEPWGNLQWSLFKSQSCESNFHCFLSWDLPVNEWFGYRIQFLQIYSPFASIHVKSIMVARLYSVTGVLLSSLLGLGAAWKFVFLRRASTWKHMFRIFCFN